MTTKRSSWKDSLRLEECEACCMGIIEIKRKDVDTSKGKIASVAKCVE